MPLTAPSPQRRFRPDITVATVVERDGRFLIVQERVRGVLVLNQPAGHLEADESLQEAALRETLEETAWQVQLQAFLGVYQWDAPDGTTFLRFAFLAQPLEPLAGRRLDRGIVRALWLSRDELKAREPELRSPLVLRVVDDALAGVRLPLDAVRRLP